MTSDANDGHRIHHAAANVVWNLGQRGYVGSFEDEKLYIESWSNEGDREVEVFLQISIKTFFGGISKKKNREGYFGVRIG